MIVRLDSEEWRAFDREHPAPTFFARPAFALAFCEANAHCEPWPVRIELGDKRYLVPLVRVHSRLAFRAACAFPLGGYGCVLDEDGETVGKDRAAEVLLEAARLVDRLTFVAWPLADQPRVAHAQQTAHRAAVIDCSAGLDGVLARMRPVTRRMAGQAARRGVLCMQARDRGSAVERYYALLEEASRGWGLASPTISRALLEAVARHGGDDAEIWFAHLDGEIIAGGVALFGRDELFFWSAAMRRAFGAYRPSNALNVRLLGRACERGVRWYNLGASEGLSGVERFKHDLGARDVEYASFTLASPGYRFYERIRTAIGVPV
jgi:CelD/BcsL family acetyltransferase involved in cellulose biosynthesis